MPLFKFCVMCGTKHEYTLTPPNWCGSCGVSLDGKVSTAERKVVVVDEKPVKFLTASEKLRQRLAAKRTQIEDIEYDETELDDDNFIPKPCKLEINVVSKKKETLADLAVGAKAERDTSKRDSGPLTFKNQKQFERDFKKLAGKTRE